MANRLTKRSKTTYTAAIPAQVARPAYCVTGPGTKVVYVDITELANQGLQTAPGYPTLFKSHLDAYGNKVIDQVLAPVLIASSSVTTCYPAAAGVSGSEAAVSTDQQVGWNSGARSYASATGDFSLSFSFPQVPSGAVICGLSSTTSTVGSFEAVEHGLYTAGPSIKFYESGVERYTFSASPAESPKLSIQRINGVVTATVDGEIYRSAARSYGEKSVSAALYASGDYVDNPSIAGAAAGSSFSALDIGQPPGITPQGSSRSANLLAGYASGQDAVSVSVPVISLDGVVSVFDTQMAAVDHGISTDQGVTRSYITVGLNSSEDEYTSARLIMSGPEVVAYDTDLFLEATISEGLIPDSDLDFLPVIYAEIVESISLGSVFTLNVLIDAKLSEILSVSGSTDVNFILSAILKSILSVSDYAPKPMIVVDDGDSGGSPSVARDEALQYATNIATGAVTRYSGFGFSSFCRVGSDLWATRPDGLYRIYGDTDNGELISWLIDFAADDQGTPRTKRLENIFFGIATDGFTYARLTDDFGRHQVYRLIQRDSSEARINTAKGASSRFWQLRLTGEQASYAEIDNIEWVAATGARRTKR